MYARIITCDVDKSASLDGPASLGKSCRILASRAIVPGAEDIGPTPLTDKVGDGRQAITSGHKRADTGTFFKRYAAATFPRRLAEANLRAGTLARNASYDVAEGDFI
jgi:hypothetical protein